MSNPKYLSYAHHGTDRAEDMICVIDLSPSMLCRDYPPSRLGAAKEAFRALVDFKVQHHPNDRVGVVGFDRWAHCIHRLAPVVSSSRSLKRRVDHAIEGYNTNITAGLKAGNAALSGGIFARIFFSRRDSEEDRATRLIVLSDGCHNADSSCPVRAAEHIKRKGVTIDVIGIGGSPAASEFNENQLKRIASRDEQGNPRYCFIADTGDLIHKFQTLAHHLRPI